MALSARELSALRRGLSTGPGADSGQGAGCHGGRSAQTAADLGKSWQRTECRDSGWTHFAVGARERWALLRLSFLTDELSTLFGDRSRLNDHDFDFVAQNSAVVLQRDALTRKIASNHRRENDTIGFPFRIFRSDNVPKFLE